jgi:hypothetical protein
VTPDELLCKIEWEGGIFEALDYGCAREALDTDDPNLARLWGELTTKWLELAPLSEQFQRALQAVTE